MSGARLLGPTGAPLPEGIGAMVRAAASIDDPRRIDIGYRAGGSSAQVMGAWNPPTLSADAASRGGRVSATARVRDLVRNEPWASAAVTAKVNLLVGAGWRLAVKPDADALRISADEAARVSREMEAAWQLWAADPLARGDVERTLGFGAMTAVAAAEQVVAGDAFGVLRLRPKADWPFRTALQLIDADRLSNPSGRVDGPKLRQGVEKDADGAPTAYHFRDGHPSDGWDGSGKAWSWTRVPRAESYGRPIVLHLYRKERPGQSRGVSRLIAGVARLKQVQRYADAEIQNAVTNALLAAVIQSSMDPQLIQEALGGTAGLASWTDIRAGLYERNPVYMGGTRMVQLPPGDELKFNASPRQTADFGAFTGVFLGSFAADMGLLRQHVTMDYSDTNFSSIRAGLVEVWRDVLRGRAEIEAMWAWPCFLAVIEDAIDAGLVRLPRGAPGLYEATAHWLRGRWIGPARGWYDPVKDKTAALLGLAGGIDSFEDAIAEQGGDFDQHLARLSEEAAAFRAAGLIPPSLRDMIPLAAAERAAPDVD